MKIKDCNISDKYPDCGKNDKISDVANKMKEDYEFNHTIVLDNNVPVGIVSVRDILEKVVARGKDCSKIIVSEIMSSPVITAELEDELKEVSKIMIDKHFLSMPVVDKKGKYIGLVSIYDVLGKLRENQRD